MVTYPSIRVHSRSFAVSLLFSTTTLVFSADPLPLSTPYWKDPAFLKSFNGTYRIEARIEPSVTTEERGLLVEAQNLMAAGNRTGALDKIRTSPLTEKSPALTFNLGNLLFETGDNTKAIAAYESALKEYPSFRRAHRNLALALVRENKLPEALDHLTEAIRLGDSDGSTYGLLGYCRLARKEFASALQAYRIAQVTEPDVAEWKAGIAQCLQETGGKEEAVALLDEVVALRPLESSYAVLLANIQIDLDRPDAAAKALELPYRLGVLAPDPTLLLAELHLRADRPDSAKSTTDSAFSKETKPGSNAILRLINTASSQGDWSFAKDLLTKAETPEPSRAMRLAKARYLIDSEEDPAAGSKLLEKLVSEDPTDGTALLALAKHHAATGQPGSAELLLERATADSVSAYEAHVELVRLLVAQSRYAEALKSTDAALALNPTEQLKTYRKALAATASAAE
jgi:tetratricopeptide (TPR) repeat protein